MRGRNLRRTLVAAGLVAASAVLVLILALGGLLAFIVASAGVSSSWNASVADLSAALTGEAGTRDSLEPATLALSTDQLARDYPRHATSLFNLVKNAEESMRGLKKGE